MQVAWMFVVAVLVTGCVSQGVKVREATELTPAQRTVIEEAIRLRLKDPNTARFGGFKARMAPDHGMIVCGTVNARKSYGGYSGSTTFFGVLRETAFTDVDMDGPGSQGASNRCAQAGLGS